MRGVRKSDINTDENSFMQSVASTSVLNFSYYFGPITISIVSLDQLVLYRAQ
jgi:hypothetical protein